MCCTFLKNTTVSVWNSVLFSSTNPFRFQFKILMDGFISHKKSSRHQLMLVGIIGGNGNLKKKEEVEEKKRTCQKIWWLLQWRLSKIWTEDTKSWCGYYWKIWRDQPNLRIPGIVNPTFRWVLLDDDKPNLISCQHIIQRNRGKRLCWSHYDGRKQKKNFKAVGHTVESDLEKKVDWRLYLVFRFLVVPIRNASNAIEAFWVYFADIPLGIYWLSWAYWA